MRCGDGRKIRQKLEAGGEQGPQTWPTGASRRLAEWISRFGRDERHADSLLATFSSARGGKERLKPKDWIFGFGIAKVW